ncbi:hypothetical protein ABKN59_003619 [Abortiporus biennis]
MDGEVLILHRHSSIPSTSICLVSRRVRQGYFLGQTAKIFRFGRDYERRTILHPLLYLSICMTVIKWYCKYFFQS